MMIQPSPCIRNKCILYPICINKKEIECEELRLYRNLVFNHSGVLMAWEILNQTLPNLKHVVDTGIWEFKEIRDRERKPLNDSESMQTK